MQKTSAKDKQRIVYLYQKEKWTMAEIADRFRVSPQSISGILKRRNVVARSQSEAQRKYSVDETFFDVLNAPEKAYFLGILYADGYNNTDRNSVNLSLKEEDQELLIDLSNLIQPNKPLQFIKLRRPTWSNHYRLVIANKHISKRLAELGCTKAKSYALSFPDFLPLELVPHFIRGYYDGDGSLMCHNNKAYSISIVGTEAFCSALAKIFKKELVVGSYMRPRHKEKNNNIRMLEISGNRQVLKVLNWLYHDATIYLKRKYRKYLDLIEYRKAVKQIRYCLICNEKHCSKGYCRRHYYQLCGGKEKRHQRYLQTGS